MNVRIPGLGFLRRRATRPVPPERDFFFDCHRRIDALLQRALSFWKRAVDWEGGGFFGLVDTAGRPLPGADKDMIQQVRHLWTFSHLNRFEDASPEVQAICGHQFRFVRDRLFVAERGEFHRSTGPRGEPRPGEMQLYPLAFGIFGLAGYAAAFPAAAEGREALEMAQQVFDGIVQKAYHPAHGFDERAYPERWCPHPKEINTQMHLLEAIAELCEAARVHGDPAAGSIETVLGHQLDLLVGKGIVERAGNFFCSRGYAEDWSLIDELEADHGHDIEVVFLAMSAARILGRQNDPAIASRLARLGRSVTTRAYDRKHGKWFYSGNPLTGQVMQRVSNIWTNFETLNGLATLYDLTGEAGYLVKLERVLSWLETKQINDAVGEWHYNVDDRGRPVDRDVFGNDCGWMSFAWKSSYHSLRALMTRKHWIEKRFPDGLSG